MTDESQLKDCALYLVQYVPDLVRGEYVNIGVLLHSPQEKCLGCLFTDDFRRIKHFHPQADVHFLRQLQAHFEMEIDEHGADLEGYLQYIRRSYSNLVQVSEPRAFRLAEPQSEIQDALCALCGSAPHRASARGHSDSNQAKADRRFIARGRLGADGKTYFDRPLDARGRSVQF